MRKSAYINLSFYKNTDSFSSFGPWWTTVRAKLTTYKKYCGSFSAFVIDLWASTPIYPVLFATRRCELSSNMPFITITDFDRDHNSLADYWYWLREVDHSGLCRYNEWPWWTHRHHREGSIFRTELSSPDNDGRQGLITPVMPWFQLSHWWRGGIYTTTSRPVSG